MARTILVIRMGSLGDVILTSATVLNLKLAYPDSHITYLTKERFAALAAMIPGVDELITIPDGISSRQLYQLVLRLDARRYDLVVDLHGNLRSWLIRTLLTAQLKEHYPKRRLERWLTVHRKQFPADHPHTIDIYNSCLTQLGELSPCRRPLLLTPTERSGAALGPRGNAVVVAPGAAHPNKQWPIERFSEVARTLHRDLNLKIIWAVTKQDAARSGLDDLSAESFVEIVDSPVEQLAQIMATARLTIANDSGLTHLSSAVGTPVLAVFGPTHPALGFQPRGLFDEIVQVEEYCRPCSLHGKKPCVRSERFCFTRITADMVAERAATMLTSNRTRHRALILDRDGTVIVEKHYLSDPDQVELIPGVAASLKLAKAAGFKLVILSNQSGVALKKFDIATVERVNARVRQTLRDAGVEIDEILYCPHHPKGIIPDYALICGCRKPATEMPERAAVELGIDLRRSYVIGDKRSDLALGRILGCRAYLVRTGYGTDTETKWRHETVGNGHTVCDDLAEAVAYILTKGLR